MQNIISYGQAAKKQHLRYRGATTECKRKTSGVGVNNLNEFALLINKYPDMCCQKCLLRFNELVANKRL